MTPMIQCCSLALAVALLAGCQPPAIKDAAGGSTRDAKPAGKAVRLVVDFDDGAEKHFLLAWQEKQTVIDALSAAARRARGIQVDVRGSGEGAMVLAIDELRNGAGDGKRNWIFYVNGQKATRGAGAYETTPEDVILWKFEVYE